MLKTGAPPPAVARLVELVRRCNAGDDLAYYPGSPLIASSILRSDDHLYLFELHGAEHATLSRTLGGDPRATVLRQDGLRGCIGLVPPPERRGLVLFDPSYEVKDEHERVVAALANAHRRFATGVYAVWYPVIDRRWVERLVRAVRERVSERFGLYELCIAPDGRGRGLTGSGMIVVNPPWTLDEEMSAALPWLVRGLSSAEGSYRLLTAQTG